MLVVRCEGNNDKAKYAVLLCGDDLDTAGGAAAACALAMRPPASNKIGKKVVDAKQGNDSMLNVLANTNDEIWLREVLQLIKVVAEASLAEAHKHGIRRTQRKAAVAGETQEPPGTRASSGKSVQQQGPPGAREQETRAAWAESFRELPAAESSRSERARSKIESVVLSNTLAGLELGPPECSKKEGNEAELKVAEARRPSTPPRSAARRRGTRRSSRWLRP